MNIYFKNDQDAIISLYNCLLQEIEPIQFIPKQGTESNERTAFEFIYIPKDEIQDACDALIILIIAFCAYTEEAPSIKGWGDDYEIDHNMASLMFNRWIIKEFNFREIQKAKSVPHSEIKELFVKSVNDFCSEDSTLITEQLLPINSGLLINESWDTISWFYESKNHFILFYYDIYCLYSR